MHHITVVPRFAFDDGRLVFVHVCMYVVMAEHSQCNGRELGSITATAIATFWDLRFTLRHKPLDSSSRHGHRPPRESDHLDIGHIIVILCSIGSS